jgi:hypothetical protein
LESNQEPINWVHEFGINEALHSTAQALSAGYSLLSFYNPTHEDYPKWQALADHWFLYK